MSKKRFKWADREKVVALHYIDGVEFPHFEKIFKPAACNPYVRSAKAARRADRRRRYRDEMGRVTELHYIGGIDFPLFHEPPYPLPKDGKKIVPNDKRGEQYVRRDVHFQARHQHQRDY